MEAPRKATRRPTRADGMAPVIGTLARFAQAFDEISDQEDGRPRYSATAFVHWLRVEVEAERRRAA